MQDTLELPRIDAAMLTPDAASTAVMAAAASVALDLRKVDLTDVALAQFGNWREAVAKLTADNTRTVLDLQTQKAVDDAVSMRQRLVKAPLADARKTAEGLKSKMAQTSKKVGEELAAIIAGYEAAGQPLTAQIEVAQKRIDDEREAARQAKEARIAELRGQVEAILSKWVGRAQLDNITAERIGAGIAALDTLTMPVELAEISGYWADEKAAARQSMVMLQQAAARREEEARLQAERERLAAERAELDAERARLAQARAVEDARVAALAKQREDDAAAESVRVAAAAKVNIEGQAEQQVLKAEPATADATDRDAPAATSPRVGAMGAGQAADAAPAAEPATPISAEPTMTLGDLNAWLAPLRIDSAGMESLGFPVVGRRKVAMLYHNTDKAAMVAAMVKHLQGLAA